jgi:hypothetical protein
MENKTSKYFKYAIGEIVLVVIGILIALQINNWNQSMQITKANQSHLTKMLKDLDFINQRLKSIVYTYSVDNVFGYPSLEESQIAVDSVINLTYIGLKKEHFSYIVNSKYFQGSSLLNIYDNTYQELLNTGKLYSLGSEKLINAIQYYYKMCERETEYHKVNVNNINKGLDHFNNGFANFFMDYKRSPNTFNLDNYPFYFDKNSKEYKNFQLGLFNIYSGQKINMSKMKQILKDTEILKATIETELKLYD